MDPGGTRRLGEGGVGRGRRKDMGEGRGEGEGEAGEEFPRMGGKDHQRSNVELFIQGT